MKDPSGGTAGDALRDPVAEVSGVHRGFPMGEGRVRVLDGVDLSIHSGDRVVLFGPSGCGKTTLLHLLALLDRPDRGAVRLRGRDSAPLSEAARADMRAKDIGLVFQRFHLLPHHSVLENIRLRARYLRGRPPPSPDREKEVLDQTGLRDRARQPARLLSGGEQQRVCIARALLCDPALLLADEPTGNLDTENSHRIRDLFRDVARNAPVVVATHDPEWLPFATRILRFERGRLCEEAP